MRCKARESKRENDCQMELVLVQNFSLQTKSNGRKALPFQPKAWAHPHDKLKSGHNPRTDEPLCLGCPDRLTSVPRPPQSASLFVEAEERGPDIGCRQLPREAFSHRRGSWPIFLGERRKEFLLKKLYLLSPINSYERSLQRFLKKDVWK